jgi:hypothetical protein
MLRLQKAPQPVRTRRSQGEHCLRVAITNHRTRRDDLELLVRETIALATGS